MGNSVDVTCLWENNDPHCIENEMILSSLDALDYTEKWLEDTVRCLREAGIDGSSAASSHPPSLLPLNVHNHAYLRLLKWDHASDPFPEVNTLNPEACHCVSLSFIHPASVFSTNFISALLSLDSVDGSGSVPGDAAGG